MDTDQSLITYFTASSKDDPNFNDKCVSLANSIKTKNHTIIQLVENLGPLLSSSLVTDREKSTLVLSLVLTYLPEDTLSSVQLNYICNFYIERLNDQHQVVPAVIKGLTPLIKSHNISDGLSVQLLTALFQHVPCQQQQLPDRYNIYNFIKTLLDKRKEEMKAMGLDLVYGIISTIDGERDPRNLLFLFNWLPEFLKSIELGQLTEEMFEVMSCYFPVDFRPSANEPSVTRENLAFALCPCLCAIPSFAELCIPLALEKLESDLRIAKLDSLGLLIEGCKNFPMETYKHHSSGIWQLIQKEIFNCKVSEDSELEERCLLTLKVILRKISLHTEFFKKIVKDIIDNLKANLKPDAILSTPSSRLIKCVAQATSETAEFVFRETSPWLTNMYNITTTPSHKAAILRRITDITSIYLSSNHLLKIDDENEDIKLISTICLKAIVDVDPEIRSTGIQSFSGLAAFIPLSIRTCFYQNLSVLIILNQENVVREAILTSLKVFGNLYYQEIQAILERIQTNGLDSFRLYLEAIGSVVCVKKLMSFSLAILVENILKTFDVSLIAMEMLSKQLKENELIIHKHLIEFENIIEKIVDYFLREIDNFDVELHQNSLNDIVKILNTIVKHLEEDAQENIIPKQLEKINSIEKCHDIKIVILLGLLACLRPNVKLYIKVDEIFEITAETKSSYICTSGSQLLANIVNKSADETVLTTYLNYIETECNNFSSTYPHTQNIIEIISFTTKALVMDSSPHMHTWINKLIQLSAENVSAARTFRILLDDSYDCLSAKSYCKRKLLYKQKFFSKITTYLVDNYGDDQKYYLVILGYLLQNIPQSILQLELKKIIRLILLCLSYCEEVEVLLVVLSTINTIIEDKNQLAEDYIQELLKYYSKLATFEKSMKIRALALKGIRLYAEYPLYKLLPLKQDILLVLGRCLDDKKRLVRKEAVEARSKWFLIDSPI